MFIFEFVLSPHVRMPRLMHELRLWCGIAMTLFFIRRFNFDEYAIKLWRFDSVGFSCFIRYDVLRVCRPFSTRIFHSVFDYRSLTCSILVDFDTNTINWGVSTATFLSTKQIQQVSNAITQVKIILSLSSHMTSCLCACESVEWIFTTNLCFSFCSAKL